MLLLIVIVETIIIFYCYISVGSSDIDTSIAIRNGSIIRIGRHMYYVHGGKKHAFPDRYTMHRMGYHWGSPNITVLGKHHHLESGPMLPSLWDHHPNMKLLSLGESKCILMVRKILPYSNPSIVLHRNQFVITWRSDPHNFRIVWLDDSSSFPYSSSLGTDLLKLSTFNLMNSSLPSLTIPGEDPRLFSYSDRKLNNNDKLIVAFATRYPRKLPEIRMSYAEIEIHNHTITYTQIHTFNYEDERGKEDQKNWSPFDFQGQLYFISNGDPHRITASGGRSEGNIIKATTISSTGNARLANVWKHGEIRGGTPALKVDGNYLTFFHSSLIPPVTDDVLRTYVFGAYVFNASYPYNILKITKDPIIHHSMYSGPWTNLPESYYLIDYVAFPMSYILTHNYRYIYLLYGKQDQEGWIAKIDLDMLVSSMVSIA